MLIGFDRALPHFSTIMNGKYVLMDKHMTVDFADCMCSYNCQILRRTIPNAWHLWSKRSPTPHWTLRLFLNLRRTKDWVSTRPNTKGIFSYCLDGNHHTNHWHITLTFSRREHCKLAAPKYVTGLALFCPILHFQLITGLADRCSTSEIFTVRLSSPKYINGTFVRWEEICRTPRLPPERPSHFIWLENIRTKHVELAYSKC